MKSSWTYSVVGAAGAVLALGISVTPAQAAQSAPAASPPRAVQANCGWEGPDVVHAEGTIIKDRAAVHTGPAAECRVTDHRSLNNGVEIYCKYTNTAGSLWYYTKFGWIYSPYIRVDKVSVPPGYITSC
ncbi:hypothetical protein ACH40D_14830 [Streptomyces olivaceoviridis]|uniref:SH3b domain-containing protein n=1 Tax=Streptomyces olivaceoviridis TaxID=1921 RepID=A0ABW7V5H8_STROI|nr:hypothetical protein [Streptomyces corchorusii]